MIDSGDPSPPRFPYAAAVFCAACVGVAAWLFLSYSYAWDVTPEELDEWWDRPSGAGSPLPGPDARWLDGPTRELLKRLPSDVRLSLRHPLLGRYVRVRGEIDGPPEGPFPGWAVTLRDASVPAHWADIHVGETVRGAPDGPRAFSGRVVFKVYRVSSMKQRLVLAVDTTRGRWTGDSVAGLAVGAMGVLVFGMTFRHWLAQRRRSRGSIDPTEAEATT